MKRNIALLLTVMLIAGLFAGCGNTSDRETQLTPAVNESAQETLASDPGANEHTTEVPSQEPTESLTSVPEPTGDITSAPESTENITSAPELTEDPVKAEALKIAELHGISESDIRGEYALLVRFSETVEKNKKLGDYSEFLYRIFPVVAKNRDLLDEDRFFYRLGALSIGVASLDADRRGQYYGNEIELSESMLLNEPEKQYHTLFHELMHFLDYSFNGEVVPVSLLDGRHLTPADTAMLSN